MVQKKLDNQRKNRYTSLIVGGPFLSSDHPMQWTLLLNSTFEPLTVVSWKKAITMIFLEKVEVIEEYERMVKMENAWVKESPAIRWLKQCYFTLRRIAGGRPR